MCPLSGAGEPGNCKHMKGSCTGVQKSVTVRYAKVTGVKGSFVGVQRSVTGDVNIPITL